MSLSLIGMPGAGKSTIGVMLAKYLVLDFIDTDILIQQKQNARLQDLINNHGQDFFRDCEENAICSDSYPQHVVATGGSAIYSDNAIQHLKQFGPVIYLALELTTLEQRINNFTSRGIAISASQNFSDLYLQRQPLYQKHADFTLLCENLDADAVCAEIIRWYALQQA